MLLKSSKVKSRHVKSFSSLLVKKRDKEIWHERMNAQDRKKTWKCKRVQQQLLFLKSQLNKS